MFRQAVIGTSIIVATLSPTVTLQGADAPILTLALQRADMPATSVKPVLPSPRLMDMEFLAPYGVRDAQGAQYLYSWPPDGARKTDSAPMLWELHGYVYRAADQSGARRMFSLGKSSGGGLLSDSHFRGMPRDVTLPALGDEQFARTQADEIGSVHGLLFVRQGTVVWEMLVRGSITFKPTEAQVLEVLQKYGPIQKARISGALGQ